MALEPFTLLYLLHGTCKYLTLYTYCLIYSLFLLELFLAYSGHSLDICCCYLVAEFVTPWTVALQAPLSMGILQARILEWVAMPSSRDINYTIYVIYIYIYMLNK